MFFLFGINSKEELVREFKLKSADGESKDTYRLFVSYSYLSVFFIPLFKWGHEFWVINSLGDEYAIDKDKAEEVMWDEDEKIRKSDLHLMKRHTDYICPYCGARLDRHYAYCHECGAKL